MARQLARTAGNGGSVAWRMSGASVAMARVSEAGVAPRNQEWQIALRGNVLREITPAYYFVIVKARPEL